MNWKKEFVKMLFPRDPGKLNIEGAYLLKHQYLPKSVFKYRCVDEKSLENLKNDTVWLAYPGDYNDPYDSALSINYDKLTNQLINKNLNSFVHNFEGKIPKDEMERICKTKKPFNELNNFLLSQIPNSKMKDFFASLPEKLCSEITEQFNQKIKRSLKICCFSAKVDTILMWTHYTDCHKGFCVEYDLTNIPCKDCRIRCLYPVLYTNKLFNVTSHIITSLTDPVNILYLTLSALSKLSEWKYENEWRLIFPGGLIPNPGPYDMGRPKTIYLGVKFDDTSDNGKRVIEIAKQKNIPVLKMTLANDKFKLIPKTLEDCKRILPGIE